MRKLIITILSFAIITASVLVETSEPAEAAGPAAGFREIKTHCAKSVKVPYLDFDLEHLSIIRDYRESREEAPQPTETPIPEEVTTEEETAVTEPVYIGKWILTAYCPCTDCCGEYATGITASGTVATEGRTVACNVLPLGSRLLIDGQEYVVEDTGYTPYGDAWIDIFFDSHDDALIFGVQEKEVFLIAD